MFDFNIAFPQILIIFLVTLFLLNRILFKPLLAVLEKRRSLTSGTKEEAAKSLSHYQVIFDSYQNRIKTGHLEGYLLKDQARHEALAARKKRLSEAQAEAQALLLEMKAELARQVEESKLHLRSDAQELAEKIASKILLRMN